MTVSRTNPLGIGKPSLTNLPYDLGKKIFEQIRNTPKPDFARADAEIEALYRRLEEESQRRA